MIDLITRLCLAYGTPGNEQTAAQTVANEISKYAETYIDKHGNVIAEMGNKDADFHIMLDAHIDQVGFVVTDIDKHGFIKFAVCGGVDKRILPATTVKILGKRKITGVIGSVPPHLADKNNTGVSDVNELFIDTGFDRKKLSELVSIGDRIVFSQKPRKLLNNRISSPGLDNRAGVACLISCAQKIKMSEAKLNYKLSFVFSTQEEVGLLGSTVTAYKLNPDEALLVDVSFAQQPFIKRDNCARLSKGPMIGMAPVLNRNISEALISIAKNKKIPYQLEIMPDSTGTNADAVSITRKGIPCGLISIPLRYMHSPIEVIDTLDVENTAELLSEYILKRGEF